MVPSPTSYLIGSAQDRKSILAAIAARYTTARARQTRTLSVCHDTFDWRIYHAGGALFVDEGADSKCIRWTKSDGALRRRAEMSEPPAFAWDLPAGHFRDELATILEMRRLLPIATVESGSEVLRVLDDARKTVARLQLDARRVSQPGSKGPARSLPTILRALPVRGYDEAFADLVQFLEEDLGLELRRTDELLDVLEAVGRVPQKYRSKPTAQLEPDQRTDEAMRGILLSLLDTILLNEAGTREDLDSEFLHDFRVSVRRTRSALSQVKGVFPQRAVDRFKKEFSWLGGLTGPTRDLDVYLLKMPAYEESLPENVRNDLAPLSRYLEKHQRLEQRKMARSLGTKRYRNLIDSWRGFLESPLPEESDLPFATRPIREVAQQRIWKAYRRVIKRGRAISPDSPAVALHDLRIDCKKLRYLMEFFRSLFDPETIGALIKALKQLQDNLGDFNDYEVQQHALVGFAHDMVEEQLATVEGLMAMGRLVEHLEEGQAKERELFHERFEEFERPGNRERSRSLFKPSKGRS